MNRIDHLVMYKSKSGRHFGRIYNRDEKNAENNKNRHNNRYTAFSSNRFLQLTPAKVTELVSNKHPNTSKENPQSKEANINRQKAFRDRFKQYLENKKQTKPTLKPFVSAVPIGRFIDDAIDTKKIKKNINMRSKKEAELVSQMSTPKKKIKNMEQVGVKFPSNTTTKKINRQGDPKIKLKIASTSNQKVSGLITSTVVKKKKNSTKATKMFNESISPVEEIREANEKQSKYSSVNTSAIEHENNTESGNLIVTPKNKEEGTSYYVSPFVTISRGARASFRKEKEARNVKYALESRKSFDLNQSIENRQKKEAAGYFRLQMQREKNQFDSLVTYWQKYAHENAIQSEYSDLIDVAIGQTKLLTTSKFKQFNNLIEQCENSEGDKVVKPEDLEGFWSLVYLQVENCKQRFERLEMLKNNDWEDLVLSEMKEKKIRNLRSMVSKTKTSKKNVTSALSAMLKEARKNFRNATKENEVGVKTPTFRCVTPHKNTWVVEDCKTPGSTTSLQGILKTPGSVRTKRMTLTFKTSPQVRLFVD